MNGQIKVGGGYMQPEKDMKNMREGRRFYTVKRDNERLKRGLDTAQKDR